MKSVKMTLNGGFHTTAAINTTFSVVPIGKLKNPYALTSFLSVHTC